MPKLSTEAMEAPRKRNAVSMTKALIKAMRPKQFAKNLFLYAALVFTAQLFNPTLFLRVTLAFLLFTVVAGSVYLLNDILDVESDRQHPEKCKRPIASGELPIAFARSALVVFMLGGILASFLLELRFGIVALAYLILQIAYCFRLKHIVLVDVFTIATGFVMRTVAGGLVISAPISHWLLLCSLLLALLLGFGKRRQEIVLLGEGVGKTRAILQEYSKPFLDQMIGLVAGVTIVCYSVYTIESDSAKLHPHLWMTVPFVLFSVCRYLYMVYEKGMGGAPEEVLRKDRHLQIGILLWFFMILFLFAYDKAGQPFLGIR